MGKSLYLGSWKHPRLQNYILKIYSVVVVLVTALVVSFLLPSQVKKSQEKSLTTIEQGVSMVPYVGVSSTVEYAEAQAVIPSIPIQSNAPNQKAFIPPQEVFIVKIVDKKKSQGAARIRPNASVVSSAKKKICNNYDLNDDRERYSDGKKLGIKFGDDNSFEKHSGVVICN